jgi:hypothetical protein
MSDRPDGIAEEFTGGEITDDPDEQDTTVDEELEGIAERRGEWMTTSPDGTVVTYGDWVARQATDEPGPS